MHVVVFGRGRRDIGSGEARGLGTWSTSEISGNIASLNLLLESGVSALDFLGRGAVSEAGSKT